MTVKLTPNQQAWVDALRSGKYKQTKGALQKGNSYCCLGVACDVAEKHGVYIHTSCGEIEGGSLSGQSNVRDWLQIRHSFGAVYSDISNETLTRMNDTFDKSFSEIADFIEANAKGLFNQPEDL